MDLQEQMICVIGSIIPHAVDVDLNDLLSEKDLSNEDNQDITHEDDNEDTVEEVLDNNHEEDTIPISVNMNEMLDEMHIEESSEPTNEEGANERGPLPTPLQIQLK